MENKNITIILFAYNEEKRIRSFLDITKNFCPIILIDNFSNDNTVSIAKEYINSIFQYQNPGYTEHPDVVRFAVSHVMTEWVFWARVDEIPTQPLLRKLDEIIQTDVCDVVQISRLNILFGRLSKTWGNDYQSVLFKKDFLDYKNNALYELTFLNTARKLVLPNKKELSIWHFSNYDISAYTNANNRYSSISAKNVLKQRISPRVNFSHSLEPVKVITKHIIGNFQLSKKLTLLRILINPSLRFFWHYIIRGGIYSGWAGFITSYLMMIEQMLTELKVWELENNIYRDKIDKYYDELKVILIAGGIPNLETDPFNEKK